MKRIIGVMGNISAGKTTLCKLIQRRWDYDFYPEEVDELVLNYYYGDRREHAYNTQVFFLSSRFRNWWHMTISPRSAVTDRIKEVIIATGTSVEGEATAAYLAERLTDHTVTVTRIASGVPVGGDLKFIDQVTLRRAMEKRHGI